MVLQDQITKSQTKYEHRDAKTKASGSTCGSVPRQHKLFPLYI